MTDYLLELSFLIIIAFMFIYMYIEEKEANMKKEKLKSFIYKKYFEMKDEKENIDPSTWKAFFRYLEKIVDDTLPLTLYHKQNSELKEIIKIMKNEVLKQNNR